MVAPKKKPVSEEDKRTDPEYFVSSQGHIRDIINVHPNINIPKEGLFVSLNGYGFLIKAGVDISIPRPVRVMLDTRIQTEMTQDEDGKDYTRDIPRFTYTLIKLGDDPAIPANADQSVTADELFDDKGKG